VLWLVRDRKLERHVVNVAQVVNGYALIPAAQSGLQVGDRVVTSPLATELSGQAVRLIEDVEQDQEATDASPDTGK
jgi:hypothetical protein